MLMQYTNIQETSDYKTHQSIEYISKNVELF